MHRYRIGGMVVVVAVLCAGCATTAPEPVVTGVDQDSGLPDSGEQGSKHRARMRQSRFMDQGLKFSEEFSLIRINSPTVYERDREADDVTETDSRSTKRGSGGLGLGNASAGDESPGASADAGMTVSIADRASSATAAEGRDNLSATGGAGGQLDEAAGVEAALDAMVQQGAQEIERDRVMVEALTAIAEGQSEMIRILTDQEEDEPESEPAAEVSSPVTSD